MSKTPINVNRFQNKVRALYGIRGENPVPTPEELQPIVVLEADRPTMAYPGGELLLWSAQVSPAIASNRSFVAAVNRIGTGLIVTVDQLFTDAICDLMIAGPNDISVNAPFLVGASGSGTVNPRDLRMLSAAAPVVQVGGTFQSFGSNLAPPWVATYRVGSSLVVGLHDVEVVLPPSTALVIVNTTVNQQLTAAFRCRERPLERGLLS